MGELKAVQFVSTSTGWIIGTHGDIIRTTNGGEDWELQIAGVNHVWDIFFIDDKFGWAAGSIYTGNFSWGYPLLDEVFLKTTDGGRSWVIQHQSNEYIGDSGPFSIFFTDRETGWIACPLISSQYNSLIMKTTDGGENWITQDSVDLHTMDLFFVNDQIGWAVGGWSVAFEVTILKTNDGGENWIPQSGGVNGTLESVWFINENTGWAVGTNNHILKTTNGGIDWINQSIGGGDQLTSVCFTDSNCGFIAGWSIYLTTEDGGTTWSIINNPNPNALSIFFINPQIGWRVGCGGAIQKTTNGGDTWDNHYSSFTGAGFTHVDFVDDRKGWVISPSDIYCTANAGESWQLQKTFQDGSFNSLHAIDSLNCWVVGNDWGNSTSLILNTTDGGNLWKQQMVAYSVSLNSVCFIEQTRGWAVGDSGLILFTEDGGQNWIQQESGVSLPLNSVDFIDPNYGWIAGDNGDNIILFTQNGGQNWSTAIQDSIPTFKSINFVNVSNGWGVGGYCNYYGTYCCGYIYHSNDGGMTWTPQYDGLGDYSSIKFINNDVGWVVGKDLSGYDYGVVLKTIDGGENWIDQKIPVGPTYGIDFVDLNNGWIVGWGGLIVHTSNGGITFIAEESTNNTQTLTNFILFNNYPNPFNPTTTIQYSIKEKSLVELILYDLLGRQVVVLVNEEQDVGQHKINFNGSELPSGIYFYRLQAGDFISTKKMVLMK